MSSELQKDGKGRKQVCIHTVHVFGLLHRSQSTEKQQHGDDDHTLKSSF